MEKTIEVKVGQTWIDKDPRVLVNRARITEIVGDRVYYERGSRKCNSDKSRFVKAFKLLEE